MQDVVICNKHLYKQKYSLLFKKMMLMKCAAEQFGVENSDLLKAKDKHGREWFFVVEKRFTSLWRNTSEYNDANLVAYGLSLKEKTKYKFELVEIGKIEIEHRSFNSNIAYINWLYVNPEHREYGIATALVKYAQKVVKEKGDTTIWLDSVIRHQYNIETEHYEDANLRLYKKLGFSEIDKYKLTNNKKLNKELKDYEAFSNEELIPMVKDIENIKASETNLTNHFKNSFSTFKPVSAKTKGMLKII